MNNMPIEAKVIIQAYKEQMNHKCIILIESMNL